MEEVVSPLTEEKIYVAVGTDVEQNMSTVIWALKNDEDSKICIIHVHQPPQMIPVMGTKFPANTVDEKIVSVYKEKQRKKTEDILDQYLQICRQNRVKAEKLYIEMESIEEGIVEMIREQKITKLVMGAAADKHYSVKMADLKSKKAIFIRQHAPANCHIWFTCKGCLILTREAKIHENKTISKLLSEFEQLVSRGKTMDSVKDGGLNGQNRRVMDWSVAVDTESRTSTGGSDEHQSDKTAEPETESGGSDEHQSDKTGEPETESGSRAVISEESEVAESSSQEEAFCCIC